MKSPTKDMTTSEMAQYLEKQNAESNKLLGKGTPSSAPTNSGFMAGCCGFFSIVGTTAVCCAKGLCTIGCKNC
jgi:hypothetical protein